MTKGFYPFSYHQRRHVSSSLMWFTALATLLTVTGPTCLPCPIRTTTTTQPHPPPQGCILGDLDEEDEEEEERRDTSTVPPPPPPPPVDTNERLRPSPSLPPSSSLEAQVTTLSGEGKIEEERKSKRQGVAGVFFKTKKMVLPTN
ncbi:hypothetical protein HMI54_005055 [Coelomomyces lativittatus]|nr:hypothetical protein HMI55_006854 [Coelomomyces lativittatus]KAJ1511248.1 hypothetical protein HMI56_005634 [Coelomomyces lativittatus]KAJ1517617.1 hypothetical protein HMI54_005055 [Coelomomyces lativittatus]